MSGVTSTGFVAKTFSELQDDLKASMRARFGAQFDLSVQSIGGQMAAIFSELLAEAWEVAEDVYGSSDPNAAHGAALDALMALTGSRRKEAFKSTVTLVAVGTAGTVVATGRVFSVAGAPTTRFAAAADATLAAPGAWASATVVALGLRRVNGGKVYQVTVPGTTAGSGGPTGTGSAIVDGTATWRYLGTGTGVVDVSAEGEVTGPLVANAGTLTVIETPVSGLASVVNLLDAELGADLEVDSTAKLRREQELRAPGSAAAAAVRADVSKVQGVTSVTVFENTSMATDGDGLPAKSFEVLVLGGTDADIRAAIYGAKPLGIETHGTTSGTVVDSAGVSHTVKHSRPADQDVWIIISVKADPDTWPSDGAAQVAEAIAEWGDARLGIGHDVASSAAGAQAFQVSGVWEVTSTLIGLSDPPVSSATLAMSIRQIARLDTSRIAVTVNLVAP